MHFRADRQPSTDNFTPLLDLCRRASEEILAHYQDKARAGLLREKSDDSPLTAADIASHRILSEGLLALDADIPLLSEESDAETIASRRSWNRFWMVDPLDGTREFLERTGEFTINVALIEDQRPRLGIIYEPRHDRAYVGQVDEGAWLFSWQDGAWASEALSTRSLPGAELVVLSSRRHRNERLSRCLAFLEARYAVQRLNSGSALKFCDLAAGRGDCYPRFSLCSEWDVAAGDALITAAGGQLTGLDGEPLKYNNRDTLLSEQFVAVGDRQAPLWAELLAELNL